MGGFYGIVSEGDCVADTCFGTDYHSHLGTKYGGMAVKTSSGFFSKIHDISEKPFRPSFNQFVENVRGNYAIGVISDLEPQPLDVDSKLGRYHLVHVGRINNLDEIVKREKGKDKYFRSFEGGVNPTDVVAILINRGKNYKDGIEIMQNEIEGSSSVLLLTEEGIIAARDKYGRTPISIGRREDSMAVTMETSGFPNQDFEFVRHLEPGETVFITPNNVEVLRHASEEMQICSFLWVYYGYPDSVYEGVNVEMMRNNSGRILGEIDEEEGIGIDIVAGIPDSGTGHAIGYANARPKVRYGRPFVKYTPSWPRSFMPQDQKIRDLVAKKKLLPIRELIRGMRLLFCEDSIVRGTQLKDNIELLIEDYGAEEVHMRPACPLLLYGCKFLNFSRSHSVWELAGRKAIKGIEGKEVGEDRIAVYADENTEEHRKMVDKVKTNLSLTSLRHQKLDDLVSAIGLPKEKLCTYCWDGIECSRCK